LFKKEKFVGTVIAYHQLLPLICITAAPCRTILIVRIDKPDKNKTETHFIQVDYQYNGSNESNGGFPYSLVEGKRQWRFELTMDSICDAQIEEATVMKDEKAGKDTNVANPVWRLIAGAENEKIPYGETLPCYRLKSGDYKPYKE
jgi:hypothetical protein